MARSANSIKNAIVAGISNVITVIIGFIAQKIFLSILGTEYLGINGLFSNIISMLAIAELGIGSAIIYSLYKPISENDKEKIKSLMLFYKKSYRLIAIIVGFLGIVIIPFLPNIIGEITIQDNVIILYLVALLDVVVSYLLTYKRSILYASQQTYVINIIHIIYLIVLNILQIVMLLLTKNYLIYLMIKVFCRILENVAITIIANKKYPYLNDKDVKKIDKKTQKGIVKRVKGLVFHKIGTFIVMGTDNIIISMFLGITTVGLYANYNLVFQVGLNLLAQVFESITASIGNLLVENNKEKSLGIYKRILMINSIIFTYAGAIVLCIMEDFITIWIGRQFLLHYAVLVVLTINLYIQGMRKTALSFKNAAGIFYEDRFVPLIEAIVNIVCSLIFLKVFGLVGVFLGTIVSTLVVIVWSYYKYMYKILFNNSFKNYIIEIIYYYFVALISIIIVTLVCSVITFESVIVQIVLKSTIAVIGVSLIQTLFFFKKDEFKYIIDLFKKYSFKVIKNKKFFIRKVED